MARRVFEHSRVLHSTVRTGYHSNRLTDVEFNLIAINGRERRRRGTVCLEMKVLTLDTEGIEKNRVQERGR